MARSSSHQGARRASKATPRGQSVVIRFPSAEAFHTWYEGDDYGPLLRIRDETTSNATAILATEFTGGRAERG